MNKKELSFTKFEKTCKYHIQALDKVCYCRLIHDTCNKFNCPKRRNNKNE